MKSIRLFWALGWLIACGDPLKHPERIEELRVLAARTEVLGELHNARPAPGQAASVRWLLAAPSALPLTWQFEACVASSATSGIPACAAAPFAESIMSAPTADEPHLEFVMPSESELFARERVIVLGAICDENGVTGAGPPGGPACSGQGSQVSFDVFVDSGVANSNPSLGSAQARIDDDVWSIAQTPLDCSALPSVRAGSGKHELRFELSEADRERLPGSDVSESLLISHFSTAGALARPYSFIDAGDAPVTAMHWEAPKSAANEGRIVRFFFVVRDHRGGADWTERALCVHP